MKLFEVSSSLGDILQIHGVIFGCHYSWVALMIFRGQEPSILGIPQGTGQTHTIENHPTTFTTFKCPPHENSQQNIDITMLKGSYKKLHEKLSNLGQGCD